MSGGSREPSHDTLAEQAVLGGMMRHPSSIPVVAGVLKASDFYRPAHQTVFAAIIGLAERGTEANITTLSDALRRSGDLTRCGGEPAITTIHEVGADVVESSAAHYAGIVANHSVTRRVLIATQKIAELANTDTGMIDAANLIERTRALIDAATEEHRARQGPTGVDLQSAIRTRLEEYRQPTPPGLPTGWPEIDDALGAGLRPGSLTIIGARTGNCKALALDTPLPTPTGWTTMGDVKAGDRLIGADGRPTEVVAATPVMTDRPCYEVEFSDGSVMVADGGHQWLTSTRAARRAISDRKKWKRTSPLGRDQRWKNAKPSVVTTEGILHTLRVGPQGQYLNHSVQLAKAFRLPEAELPVHPYVLGVWLGDGSSYDASFTCFDPEIVAAVANTGQRISTRWRTQIYGLLGIQPTLSQLNLLRNKHIPSCYLRASEEQRRELLAGLLDTDGTVNDAGTVYLSLTCKPLADDAKELILSLGYRVTTSTARVKGRCEATSTYYMVTFTPSDKVFKLTRKAVRQNLDQSSRRSCRYITDVRPVESVPVRCVQVSANDHLYLAGRNCIPTHNSLFSIALAVSAARRGVGSLLASLEMSRDEIVDRILANLAGIDSLDLSNHRITDDEWSRLYGAQHRLREAPLRIEDSASLSIARLRALATDQTRRPSGLGLVVADYLQLMQPTDDRVSRQEQVAAISDGLRRLANDFKVPVVAAAQLNRELEKRPGGRPKRSDLRESGALEQDSAYVILLHRDPDDANEIWIELAKNRFGPEKSVRVPLQAKFARIGRHLEAI